MNGCHRRRRDQEIVYACLKPPFDGEVVPFTRYSDLSVLPWRMSDVGSWLRAGRVVRRAIVKTRRVASSPGVKARIGNFVLGQNESSRFIPRPPWSLMSCAPLSLVDFTRHRAAHARCRLTTDWRPTGACLSLVQQYLGQLVSGGLRRAKAFRRRQNCRECRKGHKSRAVDRICGPGQSQVHASVRALGPAAAVRRCTEADDVTHLAQQRRVRALILAVINLGYGRDKPA